MLEGDSSPTSSPSIGGAQPFNFSRPKAVGRLSHERHRSNACAEEHSDGIQEDNSDIMSSNDYHRILGMKEEELKTVHERLSQAMSAMRQLGQSIDQSRQRENTLLRLHDQYEAENYTCVTKIHDLENKNKVLEQRLRHALLENRQLLEELDYCRLKWSEEQSKLFARFAEYESTIDCLQKKNEDLIENKENDNASNINEEGSSIKSKISQNRLNSTAEIHFLNEELMMKGLEIDRLSKELARLNCTQTSTMADTFDNGLESELEGFWDSPLSCEDEFYKPEVKVAQLSLADELQETVMKLDINSSSRSSSRSVSWNFSDKPFSRTASRVPSIRMHKRSMSDMGPLRSVNSKGKMYFPRGNRAHIGSLYPSTSLIFETHSGDILRQHERIRIKHDGIRAGHGTQLRLVLPAAGHLLESIYKFGPHSLKNNQDYTSGELDLEID